MRIFVNVIKEEMKRKRQMPVYRHFTNKIKHSNQNL
jgi:hypothetical protein